MTTMLMELLEAGDVIELADDRTGDGEVVSALVLLATETAVVLDRCDGSTPFVLTADELVAYRKFDATAS